MDKQSFQKDIYAFASIAVLYIGERLLQIAGASTGLLASWWVLMCLVACLPLARACYRKSKAASTPKKYVYRIAPIVAFLALSCLIVLSFYCNA